MVEQKKSPKECSGLGHSLYAYTDYIVIVLSVFIYLVIASKMFLHCTGNHSDSYVTKERPAKRFYDFKRHCTRKWNVKIGCFICAGALGDSQPGELCKRPVKTTCGRGEMFCLKRNGLSVYWYEDSRNLPI